MGPILLVLGYVVAWAASIYTFILFARVILDWTRVLAPRWTPPSALLVIFDWVYRLTDPPLKWMRRYIPPVRLGNVALDVGFLVVFMIVIVIGRIGNWLAYLGAVSG